MRAMHKRWQSDRPLKRTSFRVSMLVGNQHDDVKVIYETPNVRKWEYYRQKADADVAFEHFIETKEILTEADVVGQRAVNDWTPGDPVPDGWRVWDGDAESGPQEPMLIPIDTCHCDECDSEQRVVKEITVNPADPTAAYRLECGHTVI